MYKKTRASCRISIEQKILENISIFMHENNKLQGFV